jgi:hypothetical protein
VNPDISKNHSELVQMNMWKPEKDHWRFKKEAFAGEAESVPTRVKTDIYIKEPNVRFGSTAAPQQRITRTAASAGKAAPQQIDFESNILNVCFSQ